jgi:hypothetical protein
MRRAAAIYRSMDTQGRSMSINRILHDLFFAETARIGEVRDDLWNPSVDVMAYTVGHEKYQNAILEQYKLYVEMADRVSARRALTNGGGPHRYHVSCCESHYKHLIDTHSKEIADLRGAQHFEWL